jgi:hypothetical protein
MGGIRKGVSIKKEHFLNRLMEKFSQEQQQKPWR